MVDRTVLIWPDNDEPGRHYARTVAALALAAGAKKVIILQPPGYLPSKWDLADEPPGGRTAEEVLEDCKQVDQGEPPSTDDGSEDGSIRGRSLLRRGQQRLLVETSGG